MKIKILKLRERFNDEKNRNRIYKTWNYYIQKLVLTKQKKNHLNKYERMRLNYLKEHKKVEYTIMFMENILIQH